MVYPDQQDRLNHVNFSHCSHHDESQDNYTFNLCYLKPIQVPQQYESSDGHLNHGPLKVLIVIIRPLRINASVIKEDSLRSLVMYSCDLCLHL